MCDILGNSFCIYVLFICVKVLNKYCNLIEPVERRIEIGTKCGCHESVIDVSIMIIDWSLPLPFLCLSSLVTHVLLTSCWTR